jgi:hypothetical protein
MDKLTIIRSLWTTAPNGHGDSGLLTGRTDAENARAQHPCIGSVISRLRGPSRSGVPPYVALRKMSFPNEGLPIFNYYRNPGYLGAAHGPFQPLAPSLADLRPAASVGAGRWEERKHLLAGFDQLRRDLDASGSTRPRPSATAAAAPATSSTTASRSGSCSENRLSAVDGGGDEHHQQSDALQTQNRERPTRG